LLIVLIYWKIQRQKRLMSINKSGAKLRVETLGPEITRHRHEQGDHPRD